MNTVGEKKSTHSVRTGIAYAAAAYVAWGLLPLYWKLLKSVPPGQILAHRIIWSFLFTLILLFILKRGTALRQALTSGKTLFVMLLCGVLISGNWFIYIWAINHDHIVETSLGYYINPLFSVLLGMLVLKERMNIWQQVALLLAACGVTILAVQYGKIPWVALALTFSFGLYGLAKKLLASLDSTVGLALETLAVTPVALGYIWLTEVRGDGVLGQASLFETLLLIGGGVVTALPLLWFAQGSKTVSLSTMGFVQYISPTITLALGVFLFHEPFTTVHLISFSFIWSGLAVYSLSYTPWLTRLTASHSPKEEKNVSG
ncbi:EamA family transporter RarD [Aneurinibacillus uraniidurans]|uniref:EamA family transporter RarD n=1 Tax=Aneurinibacillus uraniidurans TaxID=2966586 RepID=UPI00234B98E4|nr:EamA family transporter RarD [Aneurinibacillus sp. B1]WCN39343.1 EamA family transporter RarD [Aneurinibacillus sp. B1]